MIPKQPTTRPMSLMERLAAKRQGLLTTPPPQIIVDDPEPPPTPAPGYAIANNAGGGTSGSVKFMHSLFTSIIFEHIKRLNVSRRGIWKF